MAARRRQRVGFLRYLELAADPGRGSPLRSYGAVNAWRLGSYWTVKVDVPLKALAKLQPVLQGQARLDDVARAHDAGVELPPLEIAVYKNGSGWIVDGNHRLLYARRAGLKTVPVIFTFVGR